MKSETFVCIDCETTGLEPKKDRIIEVAVMKFRFEETLDQYETLIDPEIVIPENTIEIHHITQEMVHGKPLAKEALPPLLKLVGNHTVIGHGILFDIRFIAEECKRNKIPCSIESNPYLDTLRMARLYGESPTNSLESLRRHFNIADEGAHRAMSDVIVNIEVFKHLSHNFRNVAEIHKRLEKPIQLKVMPLGKYKGRPFPEIPIEYLQWAAKKDFDQDLIFSLRSELKIRKQGSRFQDSSNPFSVL